jgi:hypothetical protein
MTQSWRIGTLVEESPPPTYDPIQTFDVVYDGPGRFKPEGTVPESEVVAGQVVTVQSPELHLPAGTVGVEPGMLAVCDACPEDPSLVGTVVRVGSRSSRGQVTAARFKVVLTGEVFTEGS